MTDITNQQPKNDLDKDITDRADLLFDDPTEDINTAMNSSVEDENSIIEEEKEQIEQSLDKAPDEITKAKKYGYLTQEEYLKKYGTLDGFKSPEQFNKYGEAWNEVSDVIKGIQKQLEERNKQIETLVKYNERIEERALQQARLELEARLQQARELNDVQAVEQLSTEKAQMDFTAVNAALIRAEQERQRAEQNFVSRNKHWFNVNLIMTDRAKQLDQYFRNQASTTNTILTYEQLADKIEAQLKVEFPDIMMSQQAGNSAPTIAPSHSVVNKSSAPGNSVDSYEKIFDKLSDDLKTVYQAHVISFRNMGKTPYSKKEYINKLKRQGEI